MAEYLAQRIIDGRFTYTAVITKYPDDKIKIIIDAYLTSKGRSDLII